MAPFRLTRYCPRIVGNRSFPARSGSTIPVQRRAFRFRPSPTSRRSTTLVRQRDFSGEFSKRITEHSHFDWITLQHLRRAATGPGWGTTDCRNLRRVQNTAVFKNRNIIWMSVVLSIDWAERAPTDRRSRPCPRTHLHCTSETGFG